MSEFDLKLDEIIKKKTSVNLFVVSGPSGAGKTVICREIESAMPALKPSVSATTRVKRSGEVDGIDYHFMKLEDFESNIASGNFIEWARIHQNLYGTPKANINKALKDGDDLVLEVDIQGAEQIRKDFPDAVLIFISPPSLSILKERLRGRKSDDESSIKIRLDRAEKEIAEISLYDYIIINKEIDESVDYLRSIIYAHKCRIK